MKKYNDTNVRVGCKDIWNAFMTEGASFGKYDIPLCPTTAKDIPKDMITWEEAREINRKHISKKKKSYCNFIVTGHKESSEAVYFSHF